MCQNIVARIRHSVRPTCARKRCDWVRIFRELSDRSRPAKIERTDGVKLRSLFLGCTGRDCITVPGPPAVTLNSLLRSAMCSCGKPLNLRPSTTCITDCGTAISKISPPDESSVCLRCSRDHARVVEVAFREELFRDTQASTRCVTSTLKSYCHRAWTPQETTS